jgi:hypothetical protein
VGDEAQVVDIAAPFVHADMVNLQVFWNWAILLFPSVPMGAMLFSFPPELAIRRSADAFGSTKNVAWRADAMAGKFVALQAWPQMVGAFPCAKGNEFFATLFLQAMAIAQTMNPMRLVASWKRAQFCRRVIRHEPSSFSRWFISGPGAVTLGSHYCIKGSLKRSVAFVHPRHSPPCRAVLAELRGFGV